MLFSSDSCDIISGSPGLLSGSGRGCGGSLLSVRPVVWSTFCSLLLNRDDLLGSIAGILLCEVLLQAFAGWLGFVESVVLLLSFCFLASYFLSTTPIRCHIWCYVTKLVSLNTAYSPDIISIPCKSINLIKNNTK